MSSKFCIPLQFHEKLLLGTFLAQTKYNLLIKNSLKWKSLRLSSAHIKICQISYVNFETTSRFLSKFCIPLQFYERLFPCTFFSSNSIYFTQNGPIKMKTFETFERMGHNLSNSLCQFLNNKSIPFQILYPSLVPWKISPLYFFSPNNIYFAHKEPIKVEIFETFERSGQNLSNSLHQFWNNKSIALQILYTPSVSWKITLRYFFSSNNIYFAEKEPIKVGIFEAFECSVKNLSNLLCQFWNEKSIPLQVLYLSSVSWKIIPLYFFSLNNIYFAHKEPIQVKIFETFEHSGQNLSTSLCQFLNDKSIPLQIVYPSSVSWKTTPLYFLTSSNIYFAYKESVKVTIFETFKCSDQNLSNFLCQFWNDK